MIVDMKKNNANMLDCKSWLVMTYGRPRFSGSGNTERLVVRQFDVRPSKWEIKHGGH